MGAHDATTPAFDTVLMLSELAARRHVPTQTLYDLPVMVGRSGAIVKPTEPCGHGRG